MVKIDRQVKEVLTHIKTAEAKKEHMQNKIEEVAPQLITIHLLIGYRRV